MKDHKRNYSRGRSPMGGTPLWSEDHYKQAIRVQKRGACRWLSELSPTHRTSLPAVITLVIFHTSDLYIFVRDESVHSRKLDTRVRQTLRTMSSKRATI